MSYTVTREAQESPHQCEFPKIRFFKHEKSRGMRVLCNECNVEWEYKYFGYSEYWGWEQVPQWV